MYTSQTTAKYPISETARRELNAFDIRKVIAPMSMMDARARLISAITRKAVVVKPDQESVYSFFVAAVIAAQHGKLSYWFAVSEAERMEEHFARESNKIEVFHDCFGEEFHEENPREAGNVRFRIVSLPLEKYLGLVERFHLEKAPKLRLANQDLEGGKVLVLYDDLNDVFVECAKQKIVDGLKGMKKMPLPAELTDLLESVKTMFRPDEADGGANAAKKYAYVEKILVTPVGDGRHRLLWLVLAPYLLNVKGTSEAEATETLVNYAKLSGDKRDLRQRVTQDVRRAKRIGLLPPTLTTLKKKHPDVYELLPDSVKS